MTQENRLVETHIYVFLCEDVTGEMGHLHIASGKRK